jgi:hypothetical protein
MTNRTLEEYAGFVQGVSSGSASQGHEARSRTSPEYDEQLPAAVASPGTQPWAVVEPSATIPLGSCHGAEPILHVVNAFTHLMD